MLCERASELFSDYCDGSIQRALHVTLENHIESCNSCRQDVIWLREVWATLDSVPFVEPPSTLRAAVWGRIEDAQRVTATAPSRSSLFARFRTAPRALGWVAAAIVAAVLLPISIPGTFHTAGLGSFFTHAPAGYSVTAAPAVAVMKNGTPFLQIPIQVNSLDSVQITVSEPKVVAVQTISVRANAPEDVVVPRPVGGNRTVLLNATWMQDGKIHRTQLRVAAP